MISSNSWGIWLSKPRNQKGLGLAKNFKFFGRDNNHPSG
jgi:hypothetical protein